MKSVILLMLLIAINQANSAGVEFKFKTENVTLTHHNNLAFNSHSSEASEIIEIEDNAANEAENVDQKKPKTIIKNLEYFLLAGFFILIIILYFFVRRKK